MSSDEEYLDDFINSLMKEEAGEGPVSSEEEKTEGFGLGEETMPEDADLAIEDLMPEEFGAGDFVMEEPEEEAVSGKEPMQEDVLEEPAAEEEPILEEEPAAEEEPILEEEPAAEEESILEEEPAAEEEPILEEEPAVEEEAILEEEPVAEEEPILEEEPVLEETPEEEVLPENVPEDIPGGEPGVENEPEEEPVFNDFGLSDFQMDEEENGEFHNEEENLISPDEVDAMFAAADAAAVEEDALFDADLQTDEIFDFLDGMNEAEEGSGDSGDPNTNGGQEIPPEEDTQGNEKKKEKKARKSLFGKKKKEKSEEETENEESTEDVSKEPEEKKRGLFGKLMTFLTEADDEEEYESKAEGLEPSDENKNILKELDDEDKNKKKKKVKTKGNEGEEGEEKGKGKKEKKKKEKKKKEKPADSEDSAGSEGIKKGKRVSIKNIAVIAGLCLTITAVIIVTCSIIPDFFDKRKAREAFYQSDYMKSYELMYGKKLDESDAIIYNKAKTILEIKRKLDSYHNYLGMGKEVQALDALMSGVENYPEILAKAEEYRVTQEVNAIYESILSILHDKYGLDEPVAQTIVAYDDVTYTKRLESIVYHTPFIMPEEKAEKTEAQETVTTADILPEEQVFMEEQNPETDEILPEEEFPQEEIQQQDQQEPDAAGQEPEDVVTEPAVTESSVQGENTSQGEDVSTWTGNSGFGSQGEQIQGIRQPLNIEIHGN